MGDAEAPATPDAPEAPTSIARVTIDSPLPQLDRLFDYAVPAALAKGLVPGVRVRVPFGGRTVSGYVVELVTPGDSEFGGRLAELERVVSLAPVLPPDLWRLARQLADRAAGSAGDVLRVAIPPRQARVENRWLAAERGVPETVDAPALTGYPDGTLERLARGERLAVSAIPRTVRLPGGAEVGHWAITLAELAAATIAAGRSAVLLVPDFRDQAQLEAAVAVLLPPASIALLDARRPDAERYAAYLRCLEPDPVVAIGNRSAVYAPVTEPGLIAIWDDGDPLYAEPLAPYVHARDAALVRQENEGSSLVLLGNTRSVEAQRLVEIGWLDSVEPPRSGRPKVVPTARQSDDEPAARAARIPSTAWRTARDALAKGPVLLQVASPGYAPWLACASCGQAAHCARCHGPLGIPRAGAAPSCRVCGALATDWHCDNCGGTRMRSGAVGSARTAEELGRAFPGVRIIIADGDHTVLQVPATPALVIATRGAEPIAVGGYRAVVLLDGERMLSRESLRVGEDCLRWWSNAAALATPGAPVLLAGASGPVADALGSWRQAAWAKAELDDRRELRFPPAVRVASVTGTPVGVAAAMTAIEDLSGVDVLGPVPTGDEQVRAIVRLDYAAGAAAAGELRAAVIAAATRRRKGPAAARGRSTPTLRVRFDDPEIL